MFDAWGEHEMNPIRLAAICGLFGGMMQVGVAFGDIQLPDPGDCTIKTLSADYTSKTGSGYSYDINKYGGDGCEVMLDVKAQLFVGPKSYPVSGWEVGGSYSYNHQVRLESPLPEGVAMPTKIPVTAALRMEGHIDSPGGYFFNVNSTVAGQGLGYSFIEDASFSFSKSVSLLVAPNTSFLAYVSGWMALAAGTGKTTAAQLIVDPFIVVDPSFAYADYFGVYQKKSDGSWVELHRDWMAAPVPEPETWFLILAGLGLVFQEARRSPFRRIGA